MNRPMAETGLSVQARFWLIGSLAVVVLPHLARLPVALAGFCVGAVAWRLLRELRGWDLPGKAATLLITVGAFGTVMGIYGTVVGHEAGAAMLVVMLCLKLIEVRSLRDGMVVVMLGYFVVVSSFLFDQSIFAGAYLFGVTALLTAALAALNHPNGDRRQWRRYVRLSGALLVQALPLMLALFFLFPRISGSLWGMAAAENAGRTGLNDQLEMGAISRLIESDELAFRAEFPEGVPTAGQLYWRGPVLWHTDGRRWRGLEEKEQSAVAGFPYRPTGEPVPYTLTLEPHERHWLLALDFPAGAPAGASITPGWQLVSQKKVRQRQHLQLEAFPAISGQPLPDSLRQWALALPAERNPRAVTLGREWRSSGLSPPEIVAKGLALFRDGPFVYTLEPPSLGANPVDEFLFGSQRGFCEHFAASFATLMRAAGIPTRLVTGYQGGEQNEVGRFLVIRQSDAHAWTEVYLEDQGWVRVDPTAVIPPNRVESGIDTGRFGAAGNTGGPGAADWMSESWRLARQGWDALNHGWNLWVLGYGSSQQRQLLEKLGLAEFGWGALIGLLAGTLGCGLAIAALVVLYRRRGCDPLVRLWQRFSEKVAKTGVVRRPHEGPRDFGRRAAERNPRARPAIEEIVRLYEGLRYGPPAHRSGTLKDLEKAVRKFRPRQ